MFLYPKGVIFDYFEMFDFSLFFLKQQNMFNLSTTIVLIYFYSMLIPLFKKL
jgi:hypothetical protein